MPRWSRLIERIEAAALNEAESLHVLRKLASMRVLERAAKFHIVDFDGLALTAHARVRCRGPLPAGYDGRGTTRFSCCN